MSSVAPSDSAIAASNRTWDACAGQQEVQAPLARLDSEVVFDSDYSLPIRYDAERRVLRYRGFMSHATYVRLAALSDDREYQTALERLFVATSPSAITPAWQVPWKGLAAGVMALVLLAAGWYQWNGSHRAGATGLQPQERNVPTTDSAGGDIAVHVPQASPAPAEGEPRHPVER